MLFDRAPLCLNSAIMQHRKLGKTGIELPILSFGASSLGQEFRNVTLDEAIRSAVSDVQSSGFKVKQIEVEPECVGAAERSGCQPQ